MSNLTSILQKVFCKVVICILIFMPSFVSADSVWAHLEEYGFQSPAQQQALIIIMETSGINDVDKILKEQTNDRSQIINDLNNFMRITQKYFNLRSTGKEYWDVTIPAWVNDKQKQKTAVAALRTIGMFEAVQSHFKTRDAICILGSTKPTMDLRLDFAVNALPAKQLILLAGERYATSDRGDISVDGSKKYLAGIALRAHKKYQELTETDLILEAYRTSRLFAKIPIVVIDTPRLNLPRPTTATTTLELIKWLRKNPEIKSITFVSNQPHIAYQKAVISNIFKQEKMHLKFDVIGPEFNFQQESPEQTIVEGIGALGAQIYAKTPAIIAKIQANSK